MLKRKGNKLNFYNERLEKLVRFLLPMSALTSTTAVVSAILLVLEKRVKRSESAKKGNSDPDQLGGKSSINLVIQSL